MRKSSERKQNKKYSRSICELWLNLKSLNRREILSGGQIAIYESLIASGAETKSINEGRKVKILIDSRQTRVLLQQISGSWGIEERKTFFFQLWVLFADKFRIGFNFSFFFIAFETRANKLNLGLNSFIKWSWRKKHNWIKWNICWWWAFSVNLFSHFHSKPISEQSGTLDV